MNTRHADDVQQLRTLLQGAGADVDPCDQFDPDGDELLFASITGPTVGQGADAVVLPFDLARPRRLRVVRDGVRRYGRRLAAGAAASVAAATLALNLAGGTQQAMALTPAMLHYTELSPDQVASGSAGRSARDVLSELAGVADRQWEEPSDGSVQYVEMYSWDADQTAQKGKLFPVHTRRWLASDGSALVDSQRDEPLSGLGSAEGELPAASVPFDAHEDSLGAGSLDPQIPARLPRSAAGLTNRAATQTPGCTQGGQSDCLVDELLTVRSTYAMPADLQATFWRALSVDTDLQLLGGVVDRAGRSGIALAAVHKKSDSSMDIRVLIVSPSTGQLLGTELMHYPAGGQGRISSLVLYVDQAWVASAGQVPARG